LIPTDVKLTVQATLPAGLDHDDWAALVCVVAAVKRSLPDANRLKAADVADYVCAAIEAYQPLPVIDVTT
jgi:hypothetical protein